MVFLYYLFEAKSILPGQYYDMPTGEKMLIRAFVEHELEQACGGGRAYGKKSRHCNHGERSLL